MQHIVKGRTVIIIAHRLAAVRDCDRIIAFDEGRICEELRLVSAWNSVACNGDRGKA
jgi:ABC-type bacteriocin/lantibiotic exporter with double-glycine peptidase domain